MIGKQQVGLKKKEINVYRMDRTLNTQERIMGVVLQA